MVFVEWSESTLTMRRKLQQRQAEKNKDAATRKAVDKEAGKWKQVKDGGEQGHASKRA